MTKLEFGMLKRLNLAVRTYAFALPPAIAIMLKKHGIACDLLHGSDWHKVVGGGKKTLFPRPPCKSTKPRRHPSVGLKQWLVLLNVVNPQIAYLFLVANSRWCWRAGMVRV